MPGFGAYLQTGLFLAVTHEHPQTSERESGCVVPAHSSAQFACLPPSINEAFRDLTFQRMVRGLRGRQKASLRNNLGQDDMSLADGSKCKWRLALLTRRERQLLLRPSLWCGSVAM